MNVNSTGKIAISGTFVYRDKDGNIIKEVPFAGHGNVVEDEADAVTDTTEEEDGNVRE